jgi:alkylhydroperoxidase/carboxymuconolactone decarboxylase family protein YurZ
MSQPEIRRTTGELSLAQQQRLADLRASIAAELPDLTARDQLRHEASHEPTVSGFLRRSIHRSTRPLATIAQQAGVTAQALDEFLTGERTLRSDVLDRLAMAVGVEFAGDAVPPAQN